MCQKVVVASLAVLAGLLTSGPLAAQRGALPGTVVLATGDEPVVPIPAVGHGPGNADVADQLFLRLGILAPPFRTAGDQALKPMLAKSWRRIDGRTLEFELDSRARWQDGAPITAHDVIYTWNLQKNPRLNPDQANLESIQSVEPTGDRTFRVHFVRPFAEQLYLFAFGFQPLPSHLLERMAAESIGTSDYAKHPVGDGPFRFDRRVPGQFVELHADTTFFLGRPTIARLLFRFARDPTARLNLLLSGDLDVMDNVPYTSADQIQAHGNLRFATAVSSNLFYILFNTRAATDTARPHAILADPRVREALTLALDRPTMARLTLGPATRVPAAAQSELWGWITPGGMKTDPQNAARAKALLADAGWRDSDGDGVVDKGGVPLALTMIYPSTSAPRAAMAIQAQQMWRAIGVKVEFSPADFAGYAARRGSGQWDLDFSTATQDASPASLVQSWSCASARQAGSSNVARWCDPEFDRLIANATTATDPATAWRAVFTRMASDRPAIFVAAPVNLVAVHTRYDNVVVLPVREWLSIWQWRVRPGAALARDH